MPSNFLLLDEPTNHLDLRAKDVLLERAPGIHRHGGVRLARPLLHRQAGHARLRSRRTARCRCFPRQLRGLPVAQDPAHRSVLHYMAGSDGQYYGAKIYSTNPRHGAHFLFLLYRAADAQPLAIMEANHLGQIRTGAASGLATKFMAREDARDAGRYRQRISGAHAVGGHACRTADLGSARLEPRSAEKRAAFAADCHVTRRYGRQSKPPKKPCAAPIVVTATYSKDAGAFLGMGRPTARTSTPWDPTRLTAARFQPSWCGAPILIAVDSIEQARMESGDLLLAFVEQDWSRVVELQELLAGHVGRTRPDELTIFKSNGLAIEDVVAAGYVYERAMEEGPA
jgi:alanine dehydrogenase